MEIVKKTAFLKNKEKYFSLLKKGRAFIYPTDTIYGIGCDATSAKAVHHIRILKKRDKRPFSVIVPSKQWVLDNCKVGVVEKKWLRKLPGKYTLLFYLEKKRDVSKEVHTGDYTLGVRIPDHWISSVVRAYGKPIVTTSVNISGQQAMHCLDDLPSSIAKGVAFVLYEGKKKGRASTIVDLLGNDVTVKKR